MTQRLRQAAALALLSGLLAGAARGAEAGSGGVYSVVEIAFRGPPVLVPRRCSIIDRTR